MKKVIITGASSGLGLELCKQYLEMGYTVVGLSRTKPDFNIEHIYADFTSEKDIDNAASHILEQHSDFSLFISCAGIGDIQNIGDIDLGNIESMMKVNLLGVMSLYAKLRETVINNGADICFIGATIGYKANEYMPAYSVSKRGLRGFIENVRHDLKPTAARVIGIHPGGLDTESNIGEHGREQIVKSMTGKSNISTMISTYSLAQYIVYTLNLPKNMEVSEIIINRK